MDTYRRLAEAEPAAYLPDLAMCLWAEAWVCNVLDIELRQALTAATESIGIYERLVKQLPQAFDRQLGAARQTRMELFDRLNGQP